MRFVPALLVVFISLIVAPCAALPADEAANQALPLLSGAGPKNQSDFGWIARAIRENDSMLPRTLATEEARAYDRPDGEPRPFVGIALSGGGSRAANFGAAVLLQLEKLGFLDHVTAISSVSGGSIAAAYYALFENPNDRARKWNEPRLKKLLATDFESKLVNKNLTPTSFFGTLIRTRNRTESMAEVLDEILFEKRTFADFRKTVLINSTGDDQFGFPFTFTDEAFWSLASRLDTFSVARAVATSAAFPGVFNSTSLLNHASLRRDSSSKPSYLHLYDGGVWDNLGIQRLDATYQKLLALDIGRQKEPRDCFIFVVNAEVSGSLKEKVEASTSPDRSDGVLVDLNALRAADQLFKRTQIQQRLRYQLNDPAGSPSTWFSTGDASLGKVCAVWHLSLQRLMTVVLNARKADLSGRWLYEGWPVVEQIPTRFALNGPPGYSVEELQNMLFDGASTLALEDPAGPLQTACAWFAARRLKSRGCGEQSGESRASFHATAGANLFDPEQQVDAGQIELPANRWYKLNWPSMFRFPVFNRFVDIKTGSSMRFAWVSIDPNASTSPGHPSPFSFHRQSDPDRRSQDFLREWLEYFVRRSPPGLEHDLAVSHLVLRQRRDAVDVYSIFLQPPSQIPAIEKSRIGEHDFHSLSVRTMVGSSTQRVEMDTKLFLSALRPESGSTAWRLFVGDVNIPAGSTKIEADEIRSTFLGVLAKLDPVEE